MSYTNIVSTTQNSKLKTQNSMMGGNQRAMYHM